MTKTILSILAIILAAGSGAVAAEKLRAPAVPLVTHDPYTSAWSNTDRLYDGWPVHWTGRIHAMAGGIRVDGKPMRWMGNFNAVVPDAVQQKALDITATQTTYTFAAGPVDLTVTFTSPLLMDDLDLLSRPVSYVTMQARSTDGAEHTVELYFDATGEWAVNDVAQQVKWDRQDVGPLSLMTIGTVDQKVLGRKGDNVRIDWGRLLVAAQKQGSVTATGFADDLRGAFAKNGKLEAGDDTQQPRPANNRWPALGVSIDLGKVGATAKSARVMIGYDDVLSIEYFQRKLKAWWRRDEGMTVEKMLQQADADYAAVLDRCGKFDAAFRAEAEKAGGREYADLCVLTYRQAIAAHKLVADVDGKTPLFFSKENFSNGSIGTVDVTYPSAPLFLVYNPTLLKGMLEPIFYYRESGKWTKPFAAHDTGTYPIANGQTYGADMPVEECGNMVILAGAICMVEGNADYAKRHWQTLTEWTKYLKESGFDPANQLCTDDFAGHLARNANLSIKAIMGIACYGKMAGMLGDKAAEEENLKLARDLAKKWMQVADDGDHYVLAFGSKNTWSQKYNMVWDKVLGLGIFPPEVAKKEIAFYLTKQNKYGLPLDSRKTYTKSDWIIWTATMADSKEDWDKIIHPIWQYVNDTPNRVPVSDWHETTNARQVGFQARSVVGGYEIKMLDERMKAKR